MDGMVNAYYVMVCWSLVKLCCLAPDLDVKRRGWRRIKKSRLFCKCHRGIHRAPLRPFMALACASSLKTISMRTNGDTGSSLSWVLQHAQQPNACLPLTWIERCCIYVHVTGAASRRRRQFGFAHASSLHLDSTERFCNAAPSPCQ